MSHEKYTGLFLNPLQAEQISRPLIHELGVEVHMSDDPDLFIQQVKRVDPRYVDSRGEPRNISRYDVTNKAHLMTSGALAVAVFVTAEQLGMQEESYPFDEFAEDADAVLVTGGQFGAYETRTNFAANGPAARIFVAGGGRELAKPDFDAMAKRGIPANELKLESDAAKLFASDLRQRGIKSEAFIPSASKPDNFIMLHEFALLHPEVKKLAVVTTGHYVTFTSYDIGAVRAILGNLFNARAYAGISDPEAVKKRTPDTYRTEIAKTLASGARMYKEQTRRS